MTFLRRLDLLRALALLTIPFPHFTNQLCKLAATFLGAVAFAVVFANCVNANSWQCTNLKSSEWSLYSSAMSSSRTIGFLFYNKGDDIIPGGQSELQGIDKLLAIRLKGTGEHVTQPGAPRKFCWEECSGPPRAPAIPTNFSCDQG
ncbi:hypothetical protein M514_02195 [Trichuris suis]|uniref:Uncharacterized protein n=1 Tax=Trichuris suis TaxID=68888 RepID=A0A085MI92_9BILA|nr:hypothetical protein M513_02195 [Trichuris suis]KFD66183.1 hypothetical protein M514_02195 [Trichuris suis]